MVKKISETSNFTMYVIFSETKYQLKPIYVKNRSK